MATEFRSTFSRVISVAVWVCCGVGAVVAAFYGLDQLAQTLPWLALASGAVWALYWRPRVIVDDGSVHLVNVFRTIDVPWPAIQAVDTKWALTLVTGYGRFTAWAAPAPGGMGAARQLRKADRQALGSTTSGLAIRAGDLPDTPSGSVALVIRTRWEQLRDAGYLDDPRMEFAAVPVRFHWLTIAGAVVLVGGCAVIAFG